MKKLINLLLLLFLCFNWLNGQNNPGQATSKDKKKIELRPNSREYGAIIRDNNHNRIDRHHNKAAYQKKKATIQQKKAVLKKNNARIKKEQVIKRRQAINQQRRNLRK